MPRPDQVRVPACAIQALDALAARSEGALAIISGRALADIDRLLWPLRMPTAGLHGAEWRDAQGTVHRIAVDRRHVTEMAQTLQPLLERHPELQLECKGYALALHYRAAPTLQEVVQKSATALAARYAEQFVLQPGKMVYEIKPKGADKGTAIQALMQGKPFAGRIPLFAGDDATDERGFEAVNARHGISIKVGSEATVARYRMTSIGTLLDWLTHINSLNSQ